MNTLSMGLLRCSLVMLAAVSAHAAEPWTDAAVPDVAYRPPLVNYQGQAQQSVGDWREANDTVARIGGWQAYAAEVWEASQTDDDESESAADSPQQHQHHHHH